jgi:cytochrome c551/c552
MTDSVGVSGAWKTVAAKYVGVSGAWKTVVQEWVGVGGVWKAGFTAFTPHSDTFDTPRQQHPSQFRWARHPLP